MANKKDNKTAHNASEYDDNVRKTIPYYDNFHEETLNLVKASGIEPGTWLDTGCGTGTLVAEAYPLFPGTRFILADPSAEMIVEAKKKLDSFRGAFRFLPPVATQDLRINDRADIITAIQSHHYLRPQAREAAIKVCFNMLEFNGMFITFENIRPMTKTGVEIGKENWLNFQVSGGRSRKEAAAHLERFDVEYFPITVEEHLSLFRKTGFKTVELFWYSYMQAGFYCMK